MRKRQAEYRELSAAFSGNEALVTVSGNRELTVEGYRGIISYEAFEVKINTRDKIICVRGEELVLLHITDELLSIAGKISAVEFI